MLTTLSILICLLTTDSGAREAPHLTRCAPPSFQKEPVEVVRVPDPPGRLLLEETPGQTRTRRRSYTSPQKASGSGICIYHIQHQQNYFYRKELKHLLRQFLYHIILIIPSVFYIHVKKHTTFVLQFCFWFCCRSSPTAVCHDLIKSAIFFLLRLHFVIRFQIKS